MATASVTYTEPRPPEVDGVTLDLTLEEASALLAILSTVAVLGVGKQTFQVFCALQDTKVCVPLYLTPVIRDSFGSPLVTFVEKS